MKTLYISDLDGTLFNKSKKISIFTADVINKCIEEGMLFSVATARMPYGCDYRLKDIHMTIPGILTNGVFLYDFKNEKYVSVENIGAEVAKQVVKIFKDVKLSCFVYISSILVRNFFIYSPLISARVFWHFSTRSSDHPS